MSQLICLFKDHKRIKHNLGTSQYYWNCKRCKYRMGRDQSFLMQIHWFIKLMIDPKPFKRREIIKWRIESIGAYLQK